ncbi:hypothetical protein [Kitasatospora mediocidica]|uniref:hypothetical protein n=1 Tax=Kitasatospora mediocidica TaxID=58352 RepID=UPI0012FCAA44|nr:hypothetical protein [Kitasatospora mediocidica]
MILVVDEHDDVSHTRAALQVHCPAEGRITVQPTPASGAPAALAHDVLYALGKRLTPGPDSPDVWMDSVDTAWLAAAAWSTVAGMRDTVVTRAHLLTARRLDQLLAWQDKAGIRLTLLWQASPRRIPPRLTDAARRTDGLRHLTALLTRPGPFPSLPRPPRSAPAAAAAGTALPDWDRQHPRPQSSRPPIAPRIRAHCPGATAAAQRVCPASAFGVTPETVAALTVLAHPLIAGALTVLSLTRSTIVGLRSVRDIDISGDISAIRTHGPGHRQCSLHTVPTWARPLLAGARTHHRLTARRVEDSLFDPVMAAESRHLRTHAERLLGQARASPEGA